MLQSVKLGCSMNKCHLTSKCDIAPTTNVTHPQKFIYVFVCVWVSVCACALCVYVTSTGVIVAYKDQVLSNELILLDCRIDK